MWEPDETLHFVDGFTPVAVHRGGTDRAAQARLTDYLTRLCSRVLPLPTTLLPLFLHLYVHVPRGANIYHGYVLEPFLSPLFGARWLNGSRFSLVIGTKGTDAASSLTIGRAAAAAATMPPACRAAPDAAPGSPEWVEQLRRALGRAGSVPLPEGPIHMIVRFRCPSERNWVGLWKPAVDAMGPILGYDQSRNPYHPRSDRLTRLEFHRRADDAIGSTVEVEYAWNAMAIDEP